MFCVVMGKKSWLMELYQIVGHIGMESELRGVM